MENLSNKITRRDFLKFLGSGAAVAVAGMTIGKLNNLGPIGANNFQSPMAVANAQSLGSWALGTNLLKVPIHVALLPNGKFFLLTGDGEDILRPNNLRFMQELLT
jgi:hypothetical protein